MTNETAFALLGALIAVAVILLAVVVCGAMVLRWFIAYVGRFKGFQANRNTKNEMVFGGMIDETPPPPPRPRFEPVDEPVLPPEALN